MTVFQICYDLRRFPLVCHSLESGFEKNAINFSATSFSQMPLDNMDPKDDGAEEEEGTGDSPEC